MRSPIREFRGSSYVRRFDLLELELEAIRLPDLIIAHHSFLGFLSARALIFIRNYLVFSMAQEGSFPPGFHSGVECHVGRTGWTAAICFPWDPRFI